MSVKLPHGNAFSLKVEDGSTARGPELMADLGERMTFGCSGARFSLCAADENGADRRPSVRPDGVRNGCMVAPAVSGANDAVDISRGSYWLSGVMFTFAGAVDVVLPRPAAGTVKIVSVAVSAGGVAAVTGGADGAAFSAVRGAAGGPPWVATGDIELALVRLSSSASAAIVDGEVVFSPEYSHSPAWSLLPYSALVRFFAPLPAIHAGATARAVWVSWHEPAMAELDTASFRAPVEQNEIDAATLAPTVKRVLPGAARLALSGAQGDLARRIERTVRLYEFRPDAGGTRVELVYAIASVTADYRPRGLAEGEAQLVAVELPVSETA